MCLTPTDPPPPRAMQQHCQCATTFQFWKTLRLIVNQLGRRVLKRNNPYCLRTPDGASLELLIWLAERRDGQKARACCCIINFMSLHISGPGDFSVEQRSEVEGYGTRGSKMQWALFFRMQKKQTCL